MRLPPPGFRGTPPASLAPAKAVPVDSAQAEALNAGKGRGLPFTGGTPGLLPGAGKGAAPGQAPQGKPPYGGAFVDPAPVWPGPQDAAGPLPDPGGVLRGSPLPLSAREALAGLALTLGLPGDNLSATILGFARYFSLPLEGGLLRKLRREALSSGASAAPQGRAAAALAAVAAADKGLGLSAGALEVYAAALDPGFSPKDPGEWGGEGRRRQGDRASPKSGEIREKALQEDAASPLLGFLNRAPGKSGGRWVVLPFAFSASGVTLRVSLRIWLRDRGVSGFEAERLALDILAENRRWLFVLDQSVKDKPGRTAVYVDPLPEGASPGALEGEIREALGGEITLHWGEIPAFADARDETLPRVDEEV